VTISPSAGNGGIGGSGGKKSPKHTGGHSVLSERGSTANAWLGKVNTDTDAIRISTMVEDIIINEFICIYSS